MDKDIAKIKSVDFAVRIVNLCRYLRETGREYALFDQLLRSGTAIGANYREARNAASRKDFINKILIALKEADETEYWLELLSKTKYLTEKEYESIKGDCGELVSLLTAIVKTAKKNCDGN
ncbi:MAG: four helix bundle protein [Clostridiales bacterium]|jgi:four helix bundle protein|nr:four helix bundle protein [Clostridiales bacterium]